MPDASVVVQGRLVDKTKTLYTQALMTSVYYRVVSIAYDDEGDRTGTEVVASTEVAVSNCIYDTPFDWDGAAEQANFRHIIGNTVFTASDTEYQIQYTFNSADGTTGASVVEVETADVL